MKKWIAIVCMLVLLLPVGDTALAGAWFGSGEDAMLHQDPYCFGRNVSFREPFAHVRYFDSFESLYGSGWLACSRCSGPSAPDPGIQLPESFRLLWNASLAEKALMLPGVWTLPSELAVPEAVAYAAAKDYAARTPAFAQYLDQVDGERLCTVSLLHYDACGAGADLRREVYKALVTTICWESVGIVTVDALTGEVCGAVLMPDGNLLVKNP